MIWQREENTGAGKIDSQLPANSQGNSLIRENDTDQLFPAELVGVAEAADISVSGWGGAGHLVGGSANIGGGRVKS